MRVRLLDILCKHQTRNLDTEIIIYINSNSNIHGQIPVLALASKTSAHQFEQKSREGMLPL